MKEIEKYIDLIEDKFDCLSIIHPPSNYLFKNNLFPFRPVLLNEDECTGLLILDTNSLEISEFYSPPEGKLVIGVDVNKNGLLLITLTTEEPDTPDCILIDPLKPSQVIEIDCKNIWYEDLGSCLKWGELDSELLVVNDFDESKTTIVTLDLQNKKINYP